MIFIERGYSNKSMHINVIPGPNDTWAVRQDEKEERELEISLSGIYTDTDEVILPKETNILCESGNFETISTRYTELVEAFRNDPSYKEKDESSIYSLSPRAMTRQKLKKYAIAAGWLPITNQTGKP